MSLKTKRNTEKIKEAGISLSLPFSLLSFFILLSSTVIAGESPKTAGEELSGYAVTAAAFAGKGGSFLVGTRKGELELWDLSREELKATFEQGEGKITAIAVSPDGKLAVATAKNQQIRVWDLSSKKLVRKVQGKAQEILAVAVSNGGNYVAYAGEDKIVHIFGEGRTIRKVWASPVSRLFFSPDGRRILILDLSGRLDLLSLPTAEVSCSNEGMVRGGLAWAVEALAWNGETIVAGDDRNLRLFDTNTCQEKGLLRGHLNAVTALAYSLDGKLILSGGQEAAIRVWDAVSGKEQYKFQTQLASVREVAFSPDNRYAMAWLEVPRTIYKVFQKWDLSTGREVESRLPFVDRNVTPERTHFPAPDAKEVQDMELEPCTAPDGSFRVSLPRAWQKSQLSPIEGIGFLCRGPAIEPERKLAMTFAFVDTSKKVYPRLASVEACLRMGSRPVLGWSEPGEEHGDIKEVTIAGRKAMAFEKRVFHRIPLHSVGFPLEEPSEGGRIVEFRRRERVMPTKTVLFYEKQIVIPDGRDFYMLHFETPAGTEATLAEVFEKSVKSFAPGFERESRP